MSLPTTANPLPPPPLTGDRALDAWNRELYRKIGQATIEAPIKALNITGQLASANASPNLVKNSTNDAKADSIDAGASATVRVYGPGGVGSNWSRYRNAALVQTHAAVTFTGKSYTTRYYIAFDTVLNTWTISTDFKNVTGDNMVTFSVLTVDPGGAGGAAGGGQSGAGGSGGVGSEGGGYGIIGL